MGQNSAAAVRSDASDEPDPAQSTADDAGPRRSLRNNLLIGALGPLLVLALITILYTALNLPSATDRLIGRGAEQLAISIGSSIDPNDQERENQRLNLIAQQPDVFFVQVDFPKRVDATTLFRAKNPDDEIAVKGPVQSFIEKTPSGGAFSWKDTRAEEFRNQLKTLESANQLTDSTRSRLEDNISRTAGTAGATTSMLVKRVGIVEAAGTREVSKEIGNADYVVSVGVITNESVNIRNNFILLFVLFAVLGAVLAVLVTFRNAQNIFQPIVDLVESANQISLGKLEDPVARKANDEVGDLAEALERMRSSLQISMARLRRRR
jgi:HAMP domain-containing protein